MVLRQHWEVIVFASGWLQHKDPGRKHLRSWAMILSVTVRISYYILVCVFLHLNGCGRGIPFDAGTGIG